MIKNGSFYILSVTFHASFGGTPEKSYGTHVCCGTPAEKYCFRATGLSIKDFYAVKQISQGLTRFKKV